MQTKKVESYFKLLLSNLFEGIRKSVAIHCIAMCNVAAYKSYRIIQKPLQLFLSYRARTVINLLSSSSPIATNQTWNDRPHATPELNFATRKNKRLFVQRHITNLTENQLSFSLISYTYDKLTIPRMEGGRSKLPQPPH